MIIIHTQRHSYNYAKAVKATRYAEEGVVLLPRDI